MDGDERKLGDSFGRGDLMGGDARPASEVEDGVSGIMVGLILVEHA
jgi:hypothetical protein